MHHKLIENRNAINIVIKNNIGKAYSHHKKQTTKDKKSNPVHRNRIY